MNELEFAELKDVEIFASGIWNGHEFNSEDLEEIVENTNGFLKKGTNKPPLKLGHSTKQILKGQTDGDPALGWMDNVRKVGNKIVADFKNVPEIVSKAIKQKLYDKVSVEMKRTPEVGFFLTGTALLGADLPAVKKLDDLSNYLASDNDKSETFDFSFSIVEPTFQQEEAKEEMTEEVKGNSLELEFAEVKKQNEEMEKLLAEYKEKEIKHLFSEKKEDVMKSFREDSKNGLLMPAILEKIENALDEQIGNFSEDSEIVFSSSLVREIADAYSQKLPEGEQASSEVVEENSNPVVAFSDKVKEIQDNTGKTYSECSEIVKRRHPELVKQVADFNRKLLKG